MEYVHNILQWFKYTGLCTVVSEVLATANKNGSQITYYTANGDWLFTVVSKVLATPCVKRKLHDQ